MVASSLWWTKDPVPILMDSTTWVGGSYNSPFRALARERNVKEGAYVSSMVRVGRESFMASVPSSFYPPTVEF